MISCEINFLCDGDDGSGDCDNYYTTEPGNFDMEEHITEATVDGGWLFTFNATGVIHNYCPDCQRRMLQKLSVNTDPATPFKKKKK